MSVCVTKSVIRALSPAIVIERLIRVCQILLLVAGLALSSPQMERVACRQSMKVLRNLITRIGDRGSDSPTRLTIRPWSVEDTESIIHQSFMDSRVTLL